MVQSVRVGGQELEAGYAVYPRGWGRFDVKRGEYDGDGDGGGERGDDSLGVKDGGRVRGRGRGKKGEGLARWVAD